MSSSVILLVAEEAGWNSHEDGGMGGGEWSCPGEYLLFPGYSDHKFVTK